MNPLAMLEALVRVDTTNPPGNEWGALTLIGGWLEEAGIPFQIQQSAPGRGNLIAGVFADAPERPPLILLSHVDVVAADPAQWTQPPFAGHSVGGYLYGRGTVDTKQLTAMQLSALLALRQSAACPRRDVLLIATCDEECGSRLGLLALLDAEWQVGNRCFYGRSLFDGADVISEGGGFPIIVGGKPLYLCEVGQKGPATLRFSVEPQAYKRPFMGANDALLRAAKLVRMLGELRLPDRQTQTFQTFLRGIERESGVAARELEAHLPPFMRKILSAMRRSTLTPTILEGATSKRVEIVCDVRLLPGVRPADIEPMLEACAQACGASYAWETCGEGYESPDGGMLAILQEATGEPVIPFLTMGSSDGRHIAPLGARVYGYSPVLPWDMTFDQAVSMVHGVDERIHADSVAFGARVLERVVARAACENNKREGTA